MPAFAKLCFFVGTTMRTVVAARCLYTEVVAGTRITLRRLWNAKWNAETLFVSHLSREMILILYLKSTYSLSY